MKTVDLYDKDFSEWALRNAELVRAGHLDEADLVHIAEEIEDLSKSRQRALQSAVTQIILRLLKYDMQPVRRTRSWLMSIAKPSRMIRIRTPQSRPGFHIPSSRSSTPLPKK